ncbi:MAG TPA: M15 family metallopeptidase [Myxococcales bacterium]|jgi:hypothetical protein
MLRLPHAVLAVAGLAALAPGCGGPADPNREDDTDPSIGVVAYALSSIDCAESSDTGYDQGSPFSIAVVHVDGKPVEVATANAYFVMAQAAEAEGVHLQVVSGFRTWAEQEYFYNCYVNCNCNSCNLAAKPGYSNHQSGHALDLNTSTASVFSWLSAHGGGFGFKKTVASEDWHWEWWGGGPGGGPCGNRAPTGWLDNAGCDSVSGWAQDPDDPGRSIDVHLYFGGPAGSGAAGVPVNAGVARSDLCGAIGSCDHGFSLLSPLSLHDGAAHAVHAYGIDSEGGPNPQLSGSPASLQCAPSPPAGVRRHVANPEVYAAWRFDAFRDQMKVADSVLDAMASEVDVAPAPVMIRADGADEVYLLDQGHRRHVPDPGVAANWRLDLATVQVKPPAEVDPIPVAKPLRSRPVLVVGNGPAVYLVDDALPVPPGPDAGAPAADAGRWPGRDASSTPVEPADGGAAASGDGSTQQPATVSGGCGCGSASGTDGLAWLAFATATALVGARRRR